MTEDEISARELRAACVHECAHALVVHLLGGYGIAHVWRNTQRAPGEKAWAGKCRMLGEPTAPAHWRRLVGLAGLVGERMAADEGHEAWEIEEYIQFALANGEVSATDAELMGEDWSEADVMQVVELLEAHWNELQMESRWLEEKASAE